MKTRSKNSARGFTLIELLVAMAITTIIISILVSVTALSLDAWNRSRSEVRAARQGKAMIDSMAHDFESMVVRKGNTFEWLYANSNPSTEGPKNNTYTSPNALDLIFFTAATDRYDGGVGTANDLGGDVSTVGYQLVFQNPIDPTSTNEDFKTFVLYRSLVNPDETFEKLLGKAAIMTEFGSVSTISEKENFICENIYEFTTTFHLSVATPTARTVRVPMGEGSIDSWAEKFSITGSGIIINDKISDVDLENNSINGVKLRDIKSARLTAVEISLTVLTDFGLKQLQKRAFADATEKAEFIAKNSYQYSKLVQVPGS